MKNVYINDENEDLCKSKRGKKWLILFLSCICSLGDFYCFNTTGAVSLKLIKKLPQDSNLIKILYSDNRLPIIIFPILGGILIQKYGYRIMLLIFGFLVFLGQFLLAIGCSFGIVPIMVIGKIIFSLGGENLIIAIFIFIIEWFKKKELGFAFAICLSCEKIGNLLNIFLSPIIAEKSDFSNTFWIGFCLSMLCLLAIICLVYLDWRQEILIQIREIVNSNTFILNNHNDSIDSFYNLPRIFYLLGILCFFIYGGILPFNYFASNIMRKTMFSKPSSKLLKMNENFNMILNFIIIVLFIPSIGYFVDIQGKRTKLLISAASLGVITYSLFIFSHPTIPFILLGITYSIFSTVIWPSLVLIVKKEIIGIAFGLSLSLQNLGIMIFPLIVKFMNVDTKNYEISIFFFLLLMIISLILSILILFEDKYMDNILNSDLVHLQKECSCNCIFKLNDKKSKHFKIDEEVNFLA